MGYSQYSFSLTTFSPSGKLVQIEHALTAVGSGQTWLGIKALGNLCVEAVTLLYSAANGVVNATEKKLPSILVDESSVQKIQLLTPNIGFVYRHLLLSDLKLAVPPLRNYPGSVCVHVQWPKHASKGIAFTKDGKYADICTRRDCKDYVNLLSCHTWEIMGVFAVDTLDLADLEWSPDDSALVMWDSPLEYKVLIYSEDGRCLFKYQAYESGLGVKTVSWSPCGKFLAVGSYDQMLRVLNHLTWKTFAEFMHLSAVRGPCYAVVFKEVDEPLQLDMY